MATVIIKHDNGTVKEVPTSEVELIIPKIDFYGRPRILVRLHGQDYYCEKIQFTE